jgi:hypothetical protein
MHQNGSQKAQTGVTTGHRLCWRCAFHLQQPSCSALSASTCFAARLLVFEALLSVLETGQLGNAVCKADELVEVDRAVAEESLYQIVFLEEAHVGSVQDCALLCKSDNSFIHESLYCIGFRFEIFDAAGGGGCLLLFGDDGSSGLAPLDPPKGTEKYYSVAGCI